MDDPLSRALDEAQPTPAQTRRAANNEQPTAQAHTIREVLEGLQSQALDALALPFFDSGTNAEIVSIRKSELSEAGELHVFGRRREPPYRANLIIEVGATRNTVPPPGGTRPVRNASLPASVGPVKSSAGLTCRSPCAKKTDV